MSRLDLHGAVLRALSSRPSVQDEWRRPAPASPAKRGMFYDTSHEVTFHPYARTIQCRIIRVELASVISFAEGSPPLDAYASLIQRQFHEFAYGPVVEDLHLLRDFIYSEYGIDSEAARKIEGLISKWRGES